MRQRKSLTARCCPGVYIEAVCVSSLQTTGGHESPEQRHIIFTSEFLRRRTFYISGSRSMPREKSVRSR